jgi:hypothetical protein
VEASRAAVERIVLPNLEDPLDRLTPGRLVVGAPGRWPLMPIPHAFDWTDPGTFPRMTYMGIVHDHDSFDGPVAEAARSYAPHDVMETKPLEQKSTSSPTRRASRWFGAARPPRCAFMVGTNWPRCRSTFGGTEMRAFRNVLGTVAFFIVLAFPLLAAVTAKSLFDTLDLLPYWLCFIAGLTVPALLVVVRQVAMQTSYWLYRRMSGGGGCMAFFVLFWCSPGAAVLGGLALNARCDRSPTVAHRTLVLDWVVPAKSGFPHCDVASWRKAGREEIDSDFVGAPGTPSGSIVVGAAAGSTRSTDVPGARTREDTIPPEGCTPGRPLTVYTRSGRLGWERAVGLSL